MAPYIAALVILVVVIRGIVFLVQQRQPSGTVLTLDWPTLGRWLAAFVSGVLFTNAVPHFVQGVSGEPFPAPLAPLLGSGILEHVSNVVWGFVNLVLGYNLFVLGKVSGSGRLAKAIFFAGVLVMGIYLASTFSR